MNKGQVVFVVNNAGIGKQIMSTVVIRGIRKKYPDRKLIVVCTVPDVFRYNPNVDEVYHMGMTPHFFTHHFVEQGFDTRMLRSEPYFDEQYLLKERHLVEAWCEQLSVEVVPHPVTGDPFAGDFFLSPKEERAALEFIRSKNKPVCIIQVRGGPMPNVVDGKVQPATVQLPVREIPEHILKNVATELVKNDFHVMALAAPGQAVWQGIERISYPLRQSLALLKYAAKTLLIDSAAQHATAAFGKQSVVCWCATSPRCLGYNKTHVNVRVHACDTPECHRPNVFWFDSGTGGQWVCPHGEACGEAYDEQDILDALLK